PEDEQRDVGRLDGPADEPEVVDALGPKRQRRLAPDAIRRERAERMGPHRPRTQHGGGGGDGAHAGAPAARRARSSDGSWATSPQPMEMHTSPERNSRARYSISSARRGTQATRAYG